MFAKAIEYLERAGQQATQRSSYSDAIVYASTALDILKDHVDSLSSAQSELPLQLTLGVSLMTTRGWSAPEVEVAFNRARELCSRMGEVPQLVPVLYGLWGFYLVRGELRKSLDIASELISLGQLSNNPAFDIAGHYTTGVTSYWMGNLQTSRLHLEDLVKKYVIEQHATMTMLFGADLGIAGTMYSGMTHSLLGFPDLALDRTSKARQMAREVHHPESLAWALEGKSEVHQARGETLKILETSEELFAICEPNGLVMQPALIKPFLGWALAADGNLVKGCVQIREGFHEFNHAGGVLSNQHGHVLLADAYLRAGEAEAGMESLTEELTSGTSEESNFGAELLRLKAELLLLHVRAEGRQGYDESERLLRQAVTLAKHQEARSLELRATVSLARLLRDTDRGAEAAEMLSTIYSWFTEGSNTADLKDAKALLEELGG
jgi:predicted ATPase